MREIRLPLMGMMLCASIVPGTAGETLPKQPAEMHAAATDVPAIVDMSRAEPKTWHTLLSPAHVNGQGPTHDPGFEELQSLGSLQHTSLVRKVLSLF